MNFIYCIIFLMLYDHGFAHKWIEKHTTHWWLCRKVDGEDICTCLPGFKGEPPHCRRECTSSGDCPEDKACLNYRCVDPCDGFCGLKATCITFTHIPSCACPAGTTGNPFERCFKNIQQYNKTIIFKYSEKENVTFDCEDYLQLTKNVEIGWVNPKSNSTTMYYSTLLNKKFKMADNGTKLGCLVTMMKDDKTIKTTMNKTSILVYMNDIESGSSQSVIIAAVVGGIFVTVMTVFVVFYCCKYWKYQPKPQPRPKLPTHKPENFYLNLLFRDQCQKEIEALEKQQEPIYEEID